MRIIKPEVILETPYSQEEIMKLLEKAGRVCYKSEDKISEGSAERFIQNIIKRGHESVIEHVSLTFRVICDRGVSHEIVRHRLASYSQESTRYCNYHSDKFSNELTVIDPVFWDKESEQYAIWLESVKKCEENYNELIELGATPQEARSILPNSLKTEIFMTMNLREWRHFLRLRNSKFAHPQMLEVASLIRDELVNRYPVIFNASEFPELIKHC